MFVTKGEGNIVKGNDWLVEREDNVPITDFRSCMRFPDQSVFLKGLYRFKIDRKVPLKACEELPFLKLRRKELLKQFEKC